MHLTTSTPTETLPPSPPTGTLALGEAALNHAARQKIRQPRHCRNLTLSTIPVQISGIALNLVGIVGLLTQIQKAHEELAWLLAPFHWTLLSESVVLQLVFIVRMLTSWRGAGGKRICFVLRCASR